MMDYRSKPQGWYAQGVYQFMPSWRLGLRYDRLDSGDPRLRSIDGVLRPVDFPTLAAAEPERSSLMLDWSPTEFSRLRLQYARDQSRESVDDDQIYLQYLMGLGAHGAHAF
jgi:outer membrane receptor protein involved in Fe transport